VNEYKNIPSGILSPEDPGFESPSAPLLFGSSFSTAILMLVAVLDETYPGQLAQLLGKPISSIQRTLDRLEQEGLVATRKLGIRRVTLNPLYPAAKELKALLLRLAEGYPEYAQI
jgi:DNA-binding transcriptional ArsR family regulator